MEKPKVNWKNLQKIEVSKVVIETKYDKVQRIRFETPEFNITYKPKKKILANTESAGFSIEDDKTEQFTVPDFILNNPMLKKLNENCKKEGLQEVQLGYGIMEGTDSENNPKDYYFMQEGQFSIMYYAGFHKDTDNLEKQKEKAKKFAEQEI